MKNFLIIISAIVLLSSCTKEPGDGGLASIKGNVRVITRLVSYQPSTTQDTLVAADRDVFIIYGDHISPDDRVWTNSNGDFEFLYLRKGTYTLYMYSDDTTGTIATNTDEFHRMPISITLEISGKKEQVDAGQLTVYEDLP